FLLLRRVVKSDWRSHERAQRVECRSHERAQRVEWAACAGALIFALHPLQTEAVAWASGMKDLLAGMFVLVALWQYVAFAQSDERRRSRWLNYVAAMLALALGMLAKPTAVVTPIIALLLDIGIIRRPIRDVMRCVWPMFLLAVPCVIWTRTAQPASLGAHVPLWLRPLIA